MSVTVREYVGPRSYRGCPVRGAAVNDDRYALAFVVVCVVLVVWAFVAPHRSQALRFDDLPPVVQSGDRLFCVTPGTHGSQNVRLIPVVDRSECKVLR